MNTGRQHDEFDYVVHFFYDDTSIFEDAHRCIGDFVMCNEEADLINKVVECLDDIFEKFGLELHDSEYIELGEWFGVIKSSNMVLDFIKRMNS